MNVRIAMHAVSQLDQYDQLWWCGALADLRCRSVRIAESMNVYQSEERFGGCFKLALSFAD